MPDRAHAVQVATIEVRFAHTQVQNAVTGVLAGQRRQLSTAQQVEAVKNVYEAVCGAREAQNKLLHVLGVSEGPPDVIEHEGDPDV